MKYIFFLGKTPALSLAEIHSMLRRYELNYKVETVYSKFAIIEINQEFNLRDFFVQLGGTIKVAETITEENNPNLQEIVLRETGKLLENNPSKKTIAYSLYFTEKENKNKVIESLKNIKQTFYEVKNQYSEKNSIRILEPQTDESEISSASIFNNKLTNPNKGAEFNFIFIGSKVIIARTVVVQDIESYSMRDYEKPGKDARIGMMPPKLAQAMINLAEVKAGEIILDPFCGTGTILQEALLNDYKVIGSDANGDQIKKCKQNLDWIAKQYELTYPDYKIFQAGFGDAMRKISNNSINAIVTESTLGPIYKKVPNKTEIKANYNTLKKLYARFFGSALNVLRPGKRIVVTLPAYQIKPGEFVFADFIDSLEKLGYSIVCPLPNEFKGKDIKITKRNTIIYSRPEQIVAREIVILQKNK
jgi:tRNA G10  N-methylase Trm11